MKTEHFAVKITKRVGPGMIRVGAICRQAVDGAPLDLDRIGQGTGGSYGSPCYIFGAEKPQGMGIGYLRSGQWDRCPLGLWSDVVVQHFKTGAEAAQWIARVKANLVEMEARLKYLQAECEALET